MVGHDHESRLTMLEADVKSLVALKNWLIGAWSVILVLIGVFALPLLKAIMR